MDRRKRVLVNPFEEATDKALCEAASRCGARVYPKVRIADALTIESSGLTAEEYGYALRAHFDFVVARHGEPVAFAVEFDGPQHRQDTRSRRRDDLKDAICKKLGMPLLRIDASDLRRVGRFSLVGWLAEVWFLWEDFSAAQARGEAPPDEPFMYDSIFAVGRKQADGTLVEITDLTEAAAALQSGEGVFFPPCNPFVSAHVRVLRFYHYSGACLNRGVETVIGRERDGRVAMLKLVRLAAGGVLLGVGRCRVHDFPAVLPHEFAEELAYLDLDEKITRFRRGELRPATDAAVEAWHVRIAE